MMSARLREPANATVTVGGLNTVAHRNDRPGPDVPVSNRAPSLDRLVKDARDAEKRITNLERTRKRTAIALLFENLDQAQRIETAVERGQSVAAFARQAGIEERRAQRLYKLAARSDKITAGSQSGRSPVWRRFCVPVLEAVSASRIDTT